MSVSVVLKNVYTFANVLSQAGTDAVISWDDKSLQNAFKWARYCQQIEKQVQGKTLRDNMDQQVHCMTLYIQPVSMIELSVDRLADAEAMLAAVLLDNPFSPAHLRSKIEGYVGNLTTNTYRQTTAIQAENKRLSTFIGGLERLQEQSPDSLAIVLMGKMVRLKHLSSTENRFTRYLENALEEISSYPSGWELMLHSLLAGTEQRASYDGVEQVKELVMKWLLETCNFHSDFWSTSIGLLTECASRSDEFLDMYLSHLISWGNAMERQYGTTSSGQLYTWCYRGELDSSSLSYESIAEHWTEVLSHNRRNRLKVQRLLVGRGQQSHFNIWKDIMFSVREHMTDTVC